MGSPGECTQVHLRDFLPKLLQRMKQLKTSFHKLKAMLHQQKSGDCSDIMTKVCNVADRIIQNRLDTGTSAPFAVQLTNELKTDYQQLNNLFLVKCDMSLEIIYIRRIIEKVKELLVYTEQSLSQIAKALGYQKPTELSEQLMTYTGLPSAHFKQIRKNKLEIIRRQQEKQNEL